MLWFLHHSREAKEQEWRSNWNPYAIKKKSPFNTTVDINTIKAFARLEFWLSLFLCLWLLYLTEGDEQDLDPLMGSQRAWSDQRPTCAIIPSTVLNWSIVEKRLSQLALHWVRSGTHYQSSVRDHNHWWNSRVTQLPVKKIAPWWSDWSRPEWPAPL